MLLLMMCVVCLDLVAFFFSSRRRHTRLQGDWSSDVCSSDLHAVQADNALLTDAEGRQYIDFAAGIAVLNTGHRHPRVVQAVQQQLERFTHTAFQIVPYESAIALAERINALAPIAGPAKTAFR